MEPKRLIVVGHEKRTDGSENYKDLGKEGLINYVARPISRVAFRIEGSISFVMIADPIARNNTK